MTIPKWAPILPLLAFLGLADALYLTAHHYLGFALACGPLSGCSTVTSSVYSVVFGIPVALFGAIYYVSMFFGFLFALEYKSITYFRWVCMASVCGLLASGWFIFVMAVLLQAWCTYCLISATTSTLLFVGSMVGLARTRPTSPASPSL